MHAKSVVPATVLALTLLATSASAQAPTSNQGPPLTRSPHPTTSPYLLLGRDRENNNNFNRNAALDYYQIIRPQRALQQTNRQQSQTIQNLQQQVQQQQQLLQDPNSLLGQTGHRSYFQNYGTYFPAKSGGGTPASFGRR